MGSKKKSETKTVQDSTQTATPWGPVTPGLQTIAGHISNVLPSLDNLNYTGDFVAQPGQLAMQVPDLYQQASQRALSLIPQAQQALAGTLTGPRFEGPGLEGSYSSFAGTNPGGMDAAVRAAVDPVYRNLTENLLPSLQSSAIESGAYGGTRAMNVLPSQTIADANREMMNLAAGMRYQDFVEQQQRQQAAYGLGTQRGLGEAEVMTGRYGLTPDLLDSIMRMSGGAAELAAAGGQAETGNRQAQIDNALQQFQYQMNRPFMGYDVATDLLTRIGQGYGTTTGHSTGSQTTVEKTGGLAPILGAALGAASMAMGLPMPGGGALGGSLVSQLFGNRGSTGHSLGG